ncbi:BrnA antitoxin family protein [Sphingomonas sp. NCPPB 2930]
MTTRSKNRQLVIPTAAEDAAIAVGIAQDDDTFEITAADMARMQPLRRLGRPPALQPKVPMTMRVDADVLEAIKASGTGWQTRVNRLLRDAVRTGKLTA